MYIHTHFAVESRFPAAALEFGGRCVDLQVDAILYYTRLYHTILYYIILYYTILYYTILYSACAASIFR